MRSLYVTASEFLHNYLYGYLLILILIGFASLAGGIYTIIYLFTIKLVKKINQRYYINHLVSILFIYLANRFNQFYFPQSPVALIAQNDELLASVGFFGNELIEILFYSLAYIIAYSAYKKNLKIICISIVFVCATVLLVFFAGQHRIVSYKNQIKILQKVILVQTGDSVFRPLSDIKINLLLNDIESIIKINKIGSEEKIIIIFPEYSFTKDQVNDDYVNAFLKKYNNIFLVAGVSNHTPKGIENTIVFKSYNNESIYEKNYLFPIGEEEVNIPLVPKKWLRPSVSVLKGNNINFFQINPNLYLLPMLCYESAIPEFYDYVLSKFRSQVSKPEVYKYFVNLSKDSFYEGTSLGLYHSLYAKWNASRVGVGMIRVSTMEHTEVIAPWGETLSKSQFGKQQIILISIPVI